MQRSRAVFVTGIIYALIGLALAGGGIWLAALGGSIFYIVLGVGILATGALLLAQRRSALWLFAIVLVGTLAWAVYEVQFDWWPLAARGDIIFPMALWLLTPVIVRGLKHVPAKWSPVRRQGHASTLESTAFPVHMGSPSDPI